MWWCFFHAGWHADWAGLSFTPLGGCGGGGLRGWRRSHSGRLMLRENCPGTARLSYSGRAVRGVGGVHPLRHIETQTAIQVALDYFCFASCSEEVKMQVSPWVGLLTVSMLASPCPRVLCEREAAPAFVRGTTAVWMYYFTSSAPFPSRAVGSTRCRHTLSLVPCHETRTNHRRRRNQQKRTETHSLSRR